MKILSENIKIFWPENTLKIEKILDTIFGRKMGREERNIPSSHIFNLHVFCTLNLSMSLWSDDTEELFLGSASSDYLIMGLIVSIRAVIYSPFTLRGCAVSSSCADSTILLIIFTGDSGVYHFVRLRFLFAFYF